MSSQLPKLNRIFSGIQPTGIPHLGNYFGALKRWIDIANQRKFLFNDGQGDCDTPIYCIVDIHAYSSPSVKFGQELYTNILRSTASLLALGLDPQRCILYRQSDLMEHSYLRSVFDSFVTTQRLTHMIQFKEKSRSVKVVYNALLNYPVLQAADILLYKSDLVPVGEDQYQHLELTRDIARRFNSSTKSDLFPEPRALEHESQHSMRIKSLRDPSLKMSKSEASKSSFIEVIEEPDVIMDKCRRALTDCDTSISFDPERRPGVSNLLRIYHLATGRSIDEVVSDFSGKQILDLKTSLAEVLIEKFRDTRQEFTRLIDDRVHLEQVLADGASKAKPLADETIRAVKNLLGSRQY